jgi:hypothetical protein
MTFRSPHLKLVGAVGAAALTVGAFASPAQAAGTTMTFTCDAPLNSTSATLTPKIPAKMAAGQALKGKMTVVVHLNSTQTATAGSLATHVAGSIKAKGEHHTIAYKVSFPKTPIDTGNSQNITATGKSTITAPKPGTYTLKAGDITANLTLSGGAAGSGTTVPQNCTAPTDGSQKLGTITVKKDTTKSKVSDSVKGKKATVHDKVKSKHGVIPTGKVKFTLKKGGKTVKAKGKLNKKGVATIHKTLTSGKWSVSAKYKGNKYVKGSTGKGTLTVK